MSKLFTELVNEGLFNEWASLLDWFFDEKKFDGWSRNQVGKLTKEIKKLPDIQNYQYDRLKRLPFKKYKSYKGINIIVGQGKNPSQAKDLIKHLRNGIAHGNARIKKHGAILWIKLDDFNLDGKQTAYIYIPISYIFKIYNLFMEIDKEAKQVCT